MAQTPLAETIELDPRNVEAVAGMRVLLCLLTSKGSDWGETLEEVKKSSGLADQPFLAALSWLERKELAGIHTTQEGTAGPYAQRVRLLKRFKLQMIPPVG